MTRVQTLSLLWGTGKGVAVGTYTPLPQPPASAGLWGAGGAERVLAALCRWVCGESPAGAGGCLEPPAGSGTSLWPPCRRPQCCGISMSGSSLACTIPGMLMLCSPVVCHSWNPGAPVSPGWPTDVLLLRHSQWYFISGIHCSGISAAHSTSGCRHFVTPNLQHSQVPVLLQPLGLQHP